MSHLQQYGRAYFVGFLFFVVTNALAINAVFGQLTAAELSALTRGQIILLLVKVLALAGTNVIAYVNTTVAKATPVPPPT
jgi:hypothetical protein